VTSHSITWLSTINQRRAIFGFRISDLIRHSGFVIRIFPKASFVTLVAALGPRCEICG
jgi:hypothetical protein